MTYPSAEAALLREPTWPRSAIRTASGRMFDLSDPQPEQVCMADIATALAHQERFTGHCPLRPTIAQHSLAVEHIAVELWAQDGVLARAQDGVPNTLRRAALMHDAAEAYVSDLSSPAKWALRPLLTGAAARNSESERAVASAFDKLEDLAMGAIVARFDCSPDGWKQQLIHEADVLARIYEAAYAGWSPQAASNLPDWLKRDVYVARCYGRYEYDGRLHRFCNQNDGGEAAFLRRARALGMHDNA